MNGYEIWLLRWMCRREREDVIGKGRRCNDEAFRIFYSSSDMIVVVLFETSSTNFSCFFWFQSLRFCSMQLCLTCQVSLLLLQRRTKNTTDRPLCVSAYENTGKIISDLYLAFILATWQALFDSAESSKVMTSKCYFAVEGSWLDPWVWVSMRVVRLLS
jgi:hypothetical protein